MAASVAVLGDQVEKKGDTAHFTTSSPSPSRLANEDGHTASNQVTTDEVRSIKWWTDEEEATVRRKLDWNILPMLFFIYGAAFIDRSNVGNAKTAGMATDLGISDAKYRIVTTIFYIAYILFQPLLLFYLVVPAHRWVAAMACLWGLSSALQATATSYSGLLAARFFVGVAEAGFGTGVALYLGFFFPRREVGFRFAWFVTSSAPASAIAGAVAYGLVKANADTAGWRLLFVVEGAPSILLSIFIYFFLPDNPRSCRFLNERQRRIADERLFKPVAVESTTNVPESGNKIISQVKSKFDAKSIKAGLSSPVGWLTALLLWTCNVGYGSVPIYLPTILSNSGLSTLDAQGYTAPPYLAAWVWSIIEVYLSDKYQHRAGFLCFNFFIGIIGYLILALKESFGARYTAVFLVTVGLFPSVPLTYVWLISNVSSARAKGIGLSILGVVSQTGPLLGTLGLFIAAEKPYFKKGMWISLGVLAAGLFVTLIATVFFVTQNHRRDRAAFQREKEVLSGGSSEVGAGAARGEKEFKGAAEEEAAVGSLSQMPATSNLEAKVILDSSIEEEKVEELRRLIEVGRQGEDSPYFRYVV